jgi:hypothetical protein
MSCNATNAFLPAQHQGTVIRPGSAEPIAGLHPPQSKFINAASDRAGLDALAALNPNSEVDFGERARLGRSEPRPRGSLGGAKCSQRLGWSDASEFGARARRTAAGAAALPIPISEFGFNANGTSFSRIAF